MAPKEINPRRIRSVYKGKRYPSIIMYVEDINAQKINAEHWRPRVGDKYSYSDILRNLARAEARCIRRNGKSLLDMFAESERIPL